MNELVMIEKVDKDSPLRAQLLAFVANFSWEEVKAHTLRMVSSWGYEDWETPLVAIINGQIVGLATVMKTDYYPLPEIFPWVSTLLVSEDFRRQGICGKLIAFANQYALALGFERTYIPTEHTGLYEKYGYRYLRDIQNYGGDIDRLYVKDLL